jgi:hypothetical protein
MTNDFEDLFGERTNFNQGHGVPEFHPEDSYLDEIGIIMKQTF